MTTGLSAKLLCMAKATDPFARMRRLAKRRDDSDVAFRAEIVRLVSEEGHSLRQVAKAAGMTNPAVLHIVRKARSA